MVTEPRCPVCDLKALWVGARDEAFTVALDMGARRGLDGVKAVLCKGHLEAWQQNLEVGTAIIVKMIQGEAEEIRRLKEGGE